MLLRCDRRGGAGAGHCSLALMRIPDNCGRIVSGAGSCAEQQREQNEESAHNADSLHCRQHDPDSPQIYRRKEYGIVQVLAIWQRARTQSVSP